MNYLVAFLTGVFASLGLGGGMVLIIYLTIFKNVDQLSAQGTNLLFFIPIAALSLIIHTKNRLIEWKKCIPSIACGIISAIIGTILAEYLGSVTLTKIFAAFILIIGIKELFQKDENRDNNNHKG
jgi:uncharacterized membrane protein YfcA